ncbi:MAG TPA: hypothetical protein VF773_13000 [Verrucomicrobiae bacterium]
MALPDKPIALEPDQVAELNKKLSTMRHNVNNYLALIVAASELLKRKPELAPRMMENIMAQPDRIIAEIREFSESFESILSIKRDTSDIVFPSSQMGQPG